MSSEREIVCGRGDATVAAFGWMRLWVNHLRLSLRQVGGVDHASSVSEVVKRKPEQPKARSGMYGRWMEAAPSLIRFGPLWSTGATVPTS